MRASLGMRQRRATPKFDRLVVAVTAIAKEAEQQHNDGENRDQYHEQPSGRIRELSAVRADVNNPSRCLLPEETSDFARIKFQSFFERQCIYGVRLDSTESLTRSTNHSLVIQKP